MKQPASTEQSAEQSPAQHRVVVIGGGIAGLATAALLAADGHSVDLLEQGDQLGGRVGSWEQDGFRFDTGASWWLMPEVFEHFFSLLGSRIEDHVELRELDPGYRVFFEDHAEPLDLANGLAANAATFERIEPGAGQRLQEYVDSAKDAYDLALRHFLYTDFSAPTALLHRDILRRTPALTRLLTQSLEQRIADRFTDNRLRQVLGYPAVFLATAPARAPSLYHLMSWLDLADGVRYPMGGFTRLIEAIAALAEKAGARLHTGATATDVLTGPRRRTARHPRATAEVRGVRYTDAAGAAQVLAADVVVGAADLHHLETRLLPRDLQTHPERRWRRRDPGLGAVLVLLGLDRTVPELAHHSLFFTEDWEANFGAIFGEDRRPLDPTSIYVCRPSATDDSVAPPGCDNLFLLVPVPADVTLGAGGVAGEGDPGVEAVADAAVAQVGGWAGVPDLAEHVVVRRTIGPADFADGFGAWQGGALGLAHTLRQSAFLRPGNTSSKVAGLHYAGASTVPGVGLPMCLISAELVLKRLRGDRSSGPL